MLTRRSLRRTKTAHQQLADEIAQLREEAATLAPGRRRDMLLRRARQDETAMRIEAWLLSPGLRAPT
ncbi:hypothetical protein [Bradyrhizobium sp.]|uniref:hypothetical protein n=1 Tax=Bradyrhizobium sp. TaxID=376 RepID=UPI0039E5E187